MQPYPPSRSGRRCCWFFAIANCHLPMRTCIIELLSAPQLLRPSQSRLEEGKTIPLVSPFEPITASTSRNFPTQGTSANETALACVDLL